MRLHNTANLIDFCLLSFDRYYDKIIIVTFRYLMQSMQSLPTVDFTCLWTLTFSFTWKLPDLNLSLPPSVPISQGSKDWTHYPNYTMTITFILYYLLFGLTSFIVTKSHSIQL